MRSNDAQREEEGRERGKGFFSLISQHVWVERGGREKEGMVASWLSSFPLLFRLASRSTDDVQISYCVK